jgi:D-3-phosphoglycerate dehydrogenase
MSSSIAIIGDRFMLPSVFAERITAACGNGIDIRTLEQPWPDQPMEHGYAGSTLDGLKEFMGDPDEVAAFIGDAT